MHWVSRAAKKIQGAFDSLHLNVAWVDIGIGQLHESLRSNVRVEFYERQEIFYRLSENDSRGT